MEFQIHGGVWPTMITPYTENGKIDYKAIPKMVDFYARRGCNGIFAICQSSEMLYLSKQEKLDLARAVTEANSGRMQIVASGHTATDLKTQFEEIEAMMKISGIGAYVLVSNALDPKNEGDDVFLERFYKTADAFPEITFGIYECPLPYKRLVTLPALKEMATSGKLVFLKDTCCDYELIRARIQATANTPLKIFNANAASFYDSYLHGGAGYNGIMANYHPELYRWALDHSKSESERAKLMADLLCEFAMIEMRLYPVSAKYHMNLVGIPMSLYSRSADCKRFDKNAKQEVDSLFALEKALHQHLGITAL
jgi:4-hydroxy-tetrahydrodipicolinate synthase